MIYADLIFIIDYSKLGEGGNFRMHCKYYQLMVNIHMREMNIDFSCNYGNINLSSYNFFLCCNFGRLIY